VHSGTSRIVGSRETAIGVSSGMFRLIATMKRGAAANIASVEIHRSVDTSAGYVRPALATVGACRETAAGTGRWIADGPAAFLETRHPAILASLADTK
jgi:hypothetical protein